MNYAKKLCASIRFHVEEPAYSSPCKMSKEESMALSELRDLFYYSYERFDDFVRMLRSDKVTRSQYEAALAILHKYEIVPPPLEPVPDVTTYRAVFRLLATQKELDLHKVVLISGLLGCEQTVYAISGALFERRKDDERMQVIVAILEAEKK